MNPSERCFYGLSQSVQKLGLPALDEPQYRLGTFDSGVRVEDGRKGPTFPRVPPDEGGVFVFVCTRFCTAAVTANHHVMTKSNGWLVEKRLLCA